MVYSNTKNAKSRVCQSQVCYLRTTHSSTLKISRIPSPNKTIYEISNHGLKGCVTFLLATVHRKKRKTSHDIIHNEITFQQRRSVVLYLRGSTFPFDLDKQSKQAWEYNKKVNLKLNKQIPQTTTSMRPLYFSTSAVYEIHNALSSIFRRVIVPNGFCSEKFLFWALWQKVVYSVNHFDMILSLPHFERGACTWNN